MLIKDTLDNEKIEENLLLFSKDINLRKQNNLFFLDIDLLAQTPKKSLDLLLSFIAQNQNDQINYLKLKSDTGVIYSTNRFVFY